MQPNELTALLTTTDEVAIWPVNVETPISNQRNKRGHIYCPSGLVKAKVIENGFRWIERRPIAVCGDTDYSINRRNGVLVEIDPEDLAKLMEFKIKSARLYRGKNTAGDPYPHCDVIKRDDTQIIRLVTSRQAVFSSWGEYALEMAKRQKEEDKKQAKYDRLRIAQAALMGHAGDLKFWDDKGFRDKNGYLAAEFETIRYDRNGQYIKDESKHKQVGHIQITIEQAEKILSILTPKQKLKLKS